MRVASIIICVVGLAAVLPGLLHAQGAVRASKGLTSDDSKVHAGSYDGSMHGVGSDLSALAGRPVAPAEWGAPGVEIRSSPLPHRANGRVCREDSKGDLVVADSDSTVRAGYSGFQPEPDQSTTGAPTEDTGVIHAGNASGKVSFIAAAGDPTS